MRIQNTIFLVKNPTKIEIEGYNNVVISESDLEKKIEFLKEPNKKRISFGKFSENHSNMQMFYSMITAR